jgi:hypothetical protein
LAQRAQTGEGTQRRIRPETSAWLMLVAFFLIFCAIIASVGYAGWRYYTTAMLPIDDLPKHGLVRVHANAGVLYQPKGKSDLNTPREVCRDNAQDVHDVCFQLDEGYRVKTVPEAGYGPVASIVLPDDTHVDLWAHPTGIDLVLKQYTVTRWNNRQQEVVFRQEAGYARYDVKASQPYADVRYTIEITNSVRVLLIPGGSYSINVPRANAAGAPTVTDSGAPMLVEVAVRSGSATIMSAGQQVAIEPRKKVQVDTVGTLGPPIAAEWELIDDGGFARYPNEKYDDTSDAWVINSAAGAQNMPPQEQNGVFTAVKECPPNKVDLCKPSDQVYVGQFRREGNQPNSYITGIDQSLEADVSEYTRSLRFTAWVRVLTQTVESTGIDGSECPIMITLTYKATSPTDKQDTLTTCVYTGPETKIQAPWIQQYIHLKEFEWQPLNIEFRDNRSQLKQVRYLQKIRIEARGHGYLSEITNVSLIGTE